MPVIWYCTVTVYAVGSAGDCAQSATEEKARAAEKAIPKNEGWAIAFWSQCNASEQPKRIGRKRRSPRGMIVERNQAYARFDFPFIERNRSPTMARALPASTNQAVLS